MAKKLSIAEKGDIFIRYSRLFSIEFCRSQSLSYGLFSEVLINQCAVLVKRKSTVKINNYEKPYQRVEERVPKTGAWVRT